MGRAGIYTVAKCRKSRISCRLVPPHDYQIRVRVETSPDGKSRSRYVWVSGHNET